MQETAASVTFEPALIGALRRARHVTVFTGAGISAESGIATFRDAPTGLWARFDPAELATPAAFRRDPALVWGWYEWRRLQVQRAAPNPGHRAIATLASKVPRLTLVTQNVDDLHERGGSEHVVHLHGELLNSFCESCRAPAIVDPCESDVPDGGRRSPPPACGQCGANLRPGVVWFGESLPSEAWQAAVRATHCDVFLCVGTSSRVQPAASLTLSAREAGALTVQVNPHVTDLDGQVDHTLRGLAGILLPQLVTAAWPA
jgi:NAD-dependent deacetylase